MTNHHKTENSFIELSSEQQENVSGGSSQPSSLQISLPQLPNFSSLGLSFPGLFGGEVNKTSFSEKQATSNKLSESGKDGDISVNDSNSETVDANSLTVG
ncbi:MAG: CTB family bacteriocin [Cyanobacteria bacterium J06621_15]